VRKRLIRSTLLIVVVAVVILGGPLVALARHQVWSSANQRLRQQATALAGEFEDQLSAGLPVDLTKVSHQLPGDRVIVTQPNGHRQVAGANLSGGIRQEAVAVTGGKVTVQAPAGPTIDKARQVTFLVLGLALLAAMAAVALAIRQARQLSEPLARLAARANALGHGDFAPRSIESGIPEIDAIAQVLDHSGGQLSALVTLQRQFASDAAHQLRTPLTGIGLRLEEICDNADTESAQEAEAALAQVERLNAVITTLLARAHDESDDPAHFDVAALLTGEAEAWRVALAAHERSLVLDVAAGVSAYARREHVVQILTALMDNALVHGSGDVTVQLHRLDRQVGITVQDDGDGVPAELRPHIFTRSVSGQHGTGIGLALARSLAVGEGGSLELSSRSPAEMVLRLPSA
jgi:signal transduction histidine kinase